MELFPPFTLTVWHAWTTFALFGLIWVVQLAIYPLFARIGPDHFCEYHESYCARITWVVAPLMLIEILSAAALLWLDSGRFDRTDLQLNFAAIVAVWVSTAMFSVPAHRRLLRGFEESAYRRLVHTNRIRTGLWSVRTLWLAGVLSHGNSIPFD